jgi:helicase SWR1
MLQKANQKRSLDDLVIQQGEFDWRTVLQPISANSRNAAEVGLEALERALGEVEDAEDAHAARVAASEEAALEGEDRADFMDGDLAYGGAADAAPPDNADAEQDGADAEQGEEEEEGGTTVDFMLTFVQRDWEFFREWRL